MTEPKYLVVRPIQEGTCVGCCLMRYGLGCLPHIKDLELGLDSCCSQEPFTGKIKHLRVFVRNTPEGRAAYVAAKLKGNDD